MNELSSPQVSDCFPDPRSRSDFDPQHYPCVNGQPAPDPLSAGRNDRIKLQFAAAYYELNGAHARLVALRQAPDFVARREEEKGLLQDIERRLVLRDQLEDEHAPLGVIAEPVVKGGLTVNLRVSFGNEDATGRRRSDCYTIIAYVPIPAPPGAIKLENVAYRVEGPLIPSPWTETGPDSPTAS